MVSKSQLAVLLSKLDVFVSPDITLEQYPTDSEIAADILHFAHLQGDIENKIICDLGCGTGILGIAALVLGAKHVYFVDKDPLVFSVLKKNLSEFVFENYTFLEKDVRSLSKNDFKLGSVDVVLQNPPFGTQETHIDKAFLSAALQLAPIVYSFHKTSTRRFVKAFVNDNNAKITHEFAYQFPIKKTYAHQKKKIHRIEVSAFRILSIV